MVRVSRVYIDRRPIEAIHVIEARASLAEHHDRQVPNEDTWARYTSLPPEVDIVGEGRNS